MSIAREGWLYITVLLIGAFPEPGGRLRVKVGDRVRGSGSLLGEWP